MVEVDSLNECFYFLENDTTHFVVIRQLNDGLLKEIENNTGKIGKQFKTLVFDFWNINESLEAKDGDKIKTIIAQYKPNSLVIKHCPIKKEFNFYQDENVLKLDGFYITDELYTMSPCLYNLFNNIRTAKLQLKKIKINSKAQLENFFYFILNTVCNQLILDDIFIEFLIKEKEDDEEYDNLDKYFTLDGGYIIIKNEVYKDLKNLKLIDTPLFCLPDDNIKSLREAQNKNIYLDIDENSLLNPGMITKFKFENDLLDVCFDLDSYKINSDIDKDYLNYLDDIFSLVVDNIDIYRKIKFKNFDVTKLEYVIGYNNHTLEEDKFILNEQEKTLKKNYENKYKELEEKIKNKKLENIDELIFDNCTNKFIDLILSMVKKGKKLNLLKIKKCANEYFYISENLCKLNIVHLNLFDVPIKFEPVQRKIKNEKLTLKIVSLEHYCKENDLSFYLVMKDIRQLLKEINTECICFEMNALPNLINFLLAEQYNSNNKNYNSNEKEEIKQYFPKKNISEDSKAYRDYYLDNMSKIDNLENKKIILKRNNIRNKLENFYYIWKASEFKDPEKEDKHKKDPSDHGKEMAYLDIDYRKFFKKNKIEKINIENCLFTNLTKTFLKSQDMIKIINENNNQTIINFIAKEEKKKEDKKEEEKKDEIKKEETDDEIDNEQYVMDIKTLKEILLKNNGIDDLAHLMKMKFSDFKNSFLPKSLFDKLKDRIIIVINNFLELKELFCLLNVLNVVENKKSDENKKIIEDDNETAIEKIKNYFIKEKSYEEGEKITHTIFNNYYSSEEEKKFIKGKELVFNVEGVNYKVKIKFVDNVKNDFDFIYQ